MLVLASISESLVNETSHFVRTAGLPGIFLLMAVSSACIPVPSEVVMLFAGFVVADHTASGVPAPPDDGRHRARRTDRHDGRLVGRLRASAAAGAWSCSNATATRSIWGRRRSSEPTAGSNATASRSCSIGRLIPVIRAFVSLPAGVARMPLARFSVLTLIGSIPWVLGFALAGHALGGDWKSVRTRWSTSTTCCSR